MNNLKAENKRLRDALTEIMRYTPRTVTRYDQFGGSYQQLTGSAFLAVLEKCEVALVSNVDED